jgi:hypothetical protein
MRQDAEVAKFDDRRRIRQANHDRQAYTILPEET